MNYNYHAHTTRCGHATGTVEEYIQKSIECGITHLGFSEHLPFIFPNGIESPFRVPVSEGKAFCDEIKAFREKYKDKIDIRVGFETEYYPEFFDDMLQNAKDFGGEYLLLGQHYFKPEYLCEHNTRVKSESIDDLEAYATSVVKAIETGFFTYVAHPDIFNFGGDDKVYQEVMRKICVASRKYSVPLEINFVGIRYKVKYPNPLFWQLAGEEKSPVTFGCDSHDLEGVFNAEWLETAKQIVKTHNLNYIGAPNLISIQD